jgi:hypothetical protein
VTLARFGDVAIDAGGRAALEFVLAVIAGVGRQRISQFRNCNSGDSLLNPDSATGATK